MRILVTDGNERAALAAARSLVEAGHAVHVAAGARVSLAGASRGVYPHPLRTHPLRAPADYAVEVSHLTQQYGIDVLLPMTDASLEAVLEHRDTLPATVVLPFADLATYRAASDKAHVLSIARECGFHVPDTRLIAAPGANIGAVPHADFFPAFAKPYRSIIPVGASRRKAEVSLVADPPALHRTLAKLPASAFPVLLQRRVSGVGEGLFALRWGGRIVALFAHRRLREKPPSGGVSVYRESIPLDEGLVGPGIRLLEALDWNGVAMIECKREHATGRYVIMEVNGRFWGSLQLAIDAGVDFPSLLVRCAAGEAVAECRQYRVGIRSRWFWGDVDHLYLRLRPRAEPQLDNGAGSRLKVVVDFLRVRPGRDRSEVWRWRDPAPFLVETLQWFGIVSS